MGLDAQIVHALEALRRRQQVLPADVMSRALGLCFITELKAAALLSASVGRGFVVKRLPRGGWGWPSAVLSFGVGAGAQLGAERVDFVLIILDPALMEAFESSVQVSLGAAAGATAGSAGVDARAQGAAGCGGGAAGYVAVSLAKGAFAGVALHTTFFAQNRHANASFYRCRATPREILNDRMHAPLRGLPLTVGEELRTFLADLEVDGKAPQRAPRPTPEQHKSNTHTEQQQQQQRAAIPTPESTPDPTHEQQSRAYRALGLDPRFHESEGLRSYRSRVADPAWLIVREQTGAHVTFSRAHDVDENLGSSVAHAIVSAPRGARAVILDGSLARGLPPPYEDYVLVMLETDARVGRVSRHCLQMT